MNEQALANRGEVLIAAYQVVVTGLAPFVETALTNKYSASPNQWFDAVNEKRQAKQPKQAKLTRRPADSTVCWDIPALLGVIEDFWWEVFEALLQERSLNTGIKLSEIRRSMRVLKDSVPLLKDLRNRASHTPASEFSEKDRDRFLNLSEHFLRAAGLDAAANLVEELNPGAAAEKKTAHLANIKAEFQNTETMRASSIIYEYLEQESLKRPLFFPNKILPMMRQQIKRLSLPIAVNVLAKDVNIQLGSVKGGTNEIENVEADEYVRKRHALTNNLIGHLDKTTFALHDIAIEGTACTVTGSLTKYLSMFAIHHAMDHELRFVSYELARENRLTVENLAASLQRRTTFFAKSYDEKRKYRALSVSAVIIYNTPNDGYKIMVRKRSAATAVDSNLLHVIPACMFQAELGNINAEWNLEFCIAKEYSEELFRCEIDPRREDPNYIYTEWKSASALKQALESGQCEILHSGVIFNLMHLLPEICCVLLVRDPDWFAVQFRERATNWEYVPLSEMLHNDGAVLADYRLDDVEDQFLENVQDFGPEAAAALAGKWSTGGLASFWLGIDAVRQRLNPQTTLF